MRREAASAKRGMRPGGANSCRVGAAAMLMPRPGITPAIGKAMAKGQKSNKEIRKPKKEGPKKQNASNPSVKEGVVRGLENFKKG